MGYVLRVKYVYRYEKRVKGMICGRWIRYPRGSRFSRHRRQEGVFGGLLFTKRLSLEEDGGGDDCG
jgi:hypothetical protein